MPRIGKSIETESRWVAARGRGWEQWGRGAEGGGAGGGGGERWGGEEWGVTT